MVEFKLGNNKVKLRPDTKIARVLAEAASRDAFYMDELTKATNASPGLVRFVIHTYLCDYVNDPTREEHKTGRPTREGGCYIWPPKSVTVRNKLL